MNQLEAIIQEVQEINTELIRDVKPPRKTKWNIGELMSTDFPDPTGPLPGIIPMGLGFP